LASPSVSANSIASEPHWVWGLEANGEKKKPSTVPPTEPVRQESAGSLLLLAAATETNLIPTLTEALPADRPMCHSAQQQGRLSSRQMLFLTLLFLGAVGLRRTWDLRGYTGEGLALLTARKSAYGYRYTEDFLTQVAQADGAERLTDALATWTKQLWHPTSQLHDGSEPPFYVDGHRKPVYSDTLIPRGLVGRLSTVLGCRALVLLHDAHGHPLLATTHRGDHHLTSGLPAIVARYEETAGTLQVRRVIVDREGMATEFLARLKASGRTIVTVLRADQYVDLTSFTEVGDFVPLCTDEHGKVGREVAPACIALPLSEHPGESLALRVALIRDLRRHVPVLPSKEDLEHPPRWDADLAHQDRRWWEDTWVATPTPAIATTPKLIPVVTTAPSVDAVELAQTYTHRWPAQENSIKDFLLPLGLDTNHGFAKMPVENSEVTKRRTTLEKRLAHVQRWAASAGKRSHQAGKRYDRLRERLNARADKLYRALNRRQDELLAQQVADHLLRREIKERKAAADAELEQIRASMWRAYEQCNQEFRKQERYCKEQREVLRALEDLKACERAMHELDSRKDQVMTICKVALANLMMWMRDHYFPATYAHATWQRLVPFLRLPGRVRREAEIVRVELRPFNDRQLNRDLALVCARVNAASPRLPDGCHLLLTVSTGEWCTLAAQQCGVT
jgi:cell division septum initiation protein DivIVA